MIRERGIQDLEGRIAQQETLRLELVAAKFKIAKSTSVATTFQGVNFENCPSCGTDLQTKQIIQDECKLCGSPFGQDKPELLEQNEVIQIDLSERIKELDESIDLHKKSLSKTKKEFSSKLARRKELDSKLQIELRQYESIFLSNIRKVDQQVATLEERMRGINRLKLMPKEIAKLEKEAADLLRKEQLLKEQILLEKSNVVRGETLIQQLEVKFLEVLIKVGVPGVQDNDRAVINRKTWDVMIWPKGEEYLSWNFYNAGSGGKKTLFNSCFMLALHILASDNDLPLPSFIIIDTPMKNIDKEVNQDIFRSFYNYVYELASTTLNNIQFIIIDNNFIPPAPNVKLMFYDRYMTNDDPNFPPLIRHYTGA